MQMLKSFGNINKYKGNGFVAFIDILGFSNEILNNWEVGINPPLKKILVLKEAISAFKFTPIKDLFNGNYSCRVQNISDTMVVSFGNDRDTPHDDRVKNLIVFFKYLTLIWRHTIEFGYTIRGAIDYGKIYWDDKEIIGPSLIKSYEAEQKIAKSSRIIVLGSLNAYLKSLIIEQTSTPLGQQLLSFLKKDVDGYIIINPHKLYDDSLDKQHLLTQIEEMKVKSKEPHHKLKYSSLLANLDTDDPEFKINELGKY